MPWLEKSSVQQRERVIADERSGQYDMTDLCGRYGISRMADLLDERYANASRLTSYYRKCVGCCG